MINYYRKMKRFRGGLVSKAHRPLYHSRLGSRVTNIFVACAQRCVHPAKTQEHAGMTLVMIDEMDALLQRASGGQASVLCPKMWLG